MFRDDFSQHVRFATALTASRFAAMAAGRHPAFTGFPDHLSTMWSCCGTRSRAQHTTLGPGHSAHRGAEPPKAGSRTPEPGPRPRWALHSVRAGAARAWAGAAARRWAAWAYQGRPGRAPGPAGAGPRRSGGGGWRGCRHGPWRVIDPADGLLPEPLHGDPLHGPHAVPAQGLCLGGQAAPGGEGVRTRRFVRSHNLVEPDRNRLTDRLAGLFRTHRRDGRLRVRPLTRFGRHG